MGRTEHRRWRFPLPTPAVGPRREIFATSWLLLADGGEEWELGDHACTPDCRLFNLSVPPRPPPDSPQQGSSAREAALRLLAARRAAAAGGTVGPSASVEGETPAAKPSGAPSPSGGTRRTGAARGGANGSGSRPAAASLDLLGGVGGAAPPPSRRPAPARRAPPQRRPAGRPQAQAPSPGAAHASLPLMSFSGAAGAALPPPSRGGSGGAGGAVLPVPGSPPRLGAPGAGGRSPPRLSGSPSRLEGGTATVFVGDVPLHWTFQEFADAISSRCEVFSVRYNQGAAFGFADVTPEAAEALVRECRDEGGLAAGDGFLRVNRARGRAQKRDREGENGEGSEVRAGREERDGEERPRRGRGGDLDAAGGTEGGYAGGTRDVRRRAADVAAAVDPRELARANLLDPPVRGLVCYDDLL